VRALHLLLEVRAAAASVRLLMTFTYSYAHEQKARGLQWVVSIGVINKTQCL
jgi:hypothetical protein